jgi:Glycoside hydrolase 123, catalytic domain
MSRRLLLAAVCAAALAVAGGAAGRIGATSPAVVTYPAAQTIPRAGRLPSGAGRSLTLNEPVGGSEAALVVVSHARQVGAAVDVRRLGPLGVRIRFVHFVRFGSALVPDALLPWDGSPHPAEQQNQPISIEVSVPHGTKPGPYKGSVTVTADAKRVVLPLTVNVYGVALPGLGQVGGNLLTAFNVGPQAYVARAISLFHYTTPDQIRAANDSLFAFLSAYRIAPNSWGFGTPGPSGYVASNTWWKDSAGNMARQMEVGQFPMLWIPLSTNRATPGNYTGGVSPLQPEKWCSYLGNTKQYWTLHGWLQTGAIPFAYPYDEPGDTHTSLLARQATALHRCFPGGEMLTTATPGASTARLWDDKGTDDVDIWAAVDWRYYGVFTVPAKEKYGNRSRRYLKSIDQARAHGKRIFAYTYYGVPGFPSFSVVEPLSNPHMFVLWTALEGIDGILYGQGLTTYGAPGDPLTKTNAPRGESILIYPGNGAPIPSARIEQIRCGIEDWEIFAVVRRRFGPAKVRQILGAHGLFSADRTGVKLACVVGCDLKSTTSQAWPKWSHDASTAGRIEAARLDALRLAAS